MRVPRRHASGPPPDIHGSARRVEPVCSDETAEAARDYAGALPARVRGGAASAARPAERERRAAFMEAARHELSGGRRDGLKVR